MDFQADIEDESCGDNDIKSIGRQIAQLMAKEDDEGEELVTSFYSDEEEEAEEVETRSIPQSPKASTLERTFTLDSGDEFEIASSDVPFKSGMCNSNFARIQNIWIILFSIKFC